MAIETTILDFQLSNTFEQYESYMNAEEQQTMFKEMGVKTFYIGKSLKSSKGNCNFSRTRKCFI